MMRLKVILPTEIYLDRDVSKVVAEGGDGSFCLLPNHVDFVSALVPSLFAYETEAGEEIFLAVDEGTIVKQGNEVHVSTWGAVQGPDLGTLRQTIDEQFRTADERERKTQTALASLEANFIRRILEMEEHA